MRRAFAVWMLLVVLLCGCWNRRESDQMDYVIAVGIDLTPTGDIALSIQSPALEAMKPRNGSKEEMVKTISVQGKTAFEAIRNYIKAAGRKLFWGHTQIYLIGEEAAKAGVERYLDFFSMDPELRGTSEMAVVKGKAKDVIEAKTEFTQLPGNYLAELIRSSNLNASAPSVPFSEFNRMMTEPMGGQPYLPVMELMEQKDYDRKIAGIHTKASEGPGQTPVVYTSGTAVFKGTKLAGYLNEKETRGLLWVQKKVKSAIVTVGNNKSGLVSLEVIRGVKASKKVTLEGDEAHLKVTLETNVNVGDRSGKVDISDESKLDELEDAFEEAVKSEVEACFQKSAVKFHSDVMAFGNTLEDKNPKVWGQVKERWEEEILPHAKLDVEVKVEIRRTSRTLYSPWVQNPNRK